jgi:hypothetical protein
MARTPCSILNQKPRCIQLYEKATQMYLGLRLYYNYEQGRSLAPETFYVKYVIERNPPIQSVAGNIIA